MVISMAQWAIIRRKVSESGDESNFILAESYKILIRNLKLRLQSYQIIRHHLIRNWHAVSRRIGNGFYDNDFQYSIHTSHHIYIYRCMYISRVYSLVTPVTDVASKSWTFHQYFIHYVNDSMMKTISKCVPLLLMKRLGVHAFADAVIIICSIHDTAEQNIEYSNTLTEHRLYLDLTIGILFLALPGRLRGVCHKYSRQSWPRNGLMFL